MYYLFLLIIWSNRNDTRRKPWDIALLHDTYVSIKKYREGLIILTNKYAAALQQSKYIWQAIVFCSGQK